jgi:hypothetical protein
MNARNETGDTAAIITFAATIGLALFTMLYPSPWLLVAAPILAVIVVLGLAVGEGE